MKCPNCGGEVDSQSTACPYCNSTYEPGRLFQLELAEKMAKNKLLPQFILKNRTPDMVQMLLTRVIISFSVAAVVFTVAAFGIYMLADNRIARTPKEGTYAWKYAQESDRRIENEMVREYMYEIVIAVDTGEAIRESALDYVLSNSYKILVDEADSRAAEQVRAFMIGYLQMTEEEITQFAVEHEYYSDTMAAREALVQKLLERLGGAK